MAGDGIIDPLTMFTKFGGLLYHLGLADEEQRRTVLHYEERLATAIVQKRWRDAFMAFDEMLNGDFWPYPTFYVRTTGQL
jgi:vitellogenic carboxypeptidase-like protein